MAIEAKHITALTEAMATGCTVPVDGKDLVFSALDFGDMGEVLQFNKSLAVQSYLMAIDGMDVERSERLNMLYGLQMRVAKNEDFIPSDPARMIYMAWLSLRHEHPKITKEEVAAIFKDEKTCDLIVDVVGVMTRGPAGDPADPLECEGPETNTQTSSH